MRAWVRYPDISQQVEKMSAIYFSQNQWDGIIPAQLGRNELDTHKHT